jgi:hypothetical protein
LGLRTWQGEEATRLAHGITQGAESAAQTDEVEEIAVLTGRGIGLMFNCT